MVIAGNITVALADLADVCGRMEPFAPGSSSTIAQFEGQTGPILTDMTAAVERLREQAETVSWESY